MEQVKLIAIPGVGSAWGLFYFYLIISQYLLRLIVVFILKFELLKYVNN